jgi:UPF0755 protein
MQKINFSDLLSLKQFALVAIFFFAVMAILYLTFFTSNYFKGNSPLKFEIKRGESLNSIIESLYLKGIIPSKTNFKIAAVVYGAEKKLRAARYEIPNGLSYVELVELFLSGKADFLRKVKIYEGSTLNSTAGTLKLDALIDSALFVQASSTKSFLDSLGIFASSAEGYLLPGEYFVYERSDPREVIKIIYDAFKKFVVDSLQNNSLQRKYSLHQVLTLASIVEGETNKVSEMPTIAGVYYNRLKIGMKLQADPTIQYLLIDGWRRLTYSDLQINNPYNTYKFSGLPPGPINNPGRDALRAAFNPEQHKFLFFVADGNGGHNFAENYSKHLKFVQAYRSWLETQKES